jgi:ABC-2 type transport system ATP-binding protein
MTLDAPLLFTNVTVCYGEVQALDRLTVEIPPGQITALVGPNGAGKTTALRLAAGLAHPVSGSARIFGHDPVTEPIAARQRLAFLPDRPTLPPHLTVLELLHLRAGLWGVHDRQAVGGRAQALLAELGISGFEHRRGQALSHGQAQRVALAAVLITEPQLLLVDEPMTALDLEAQVAVRAVLRTTANSGAAIVITTHTVAHVAALADDVVRIEHGRLVGRRAGVRDPQELERWLLERSG